MVVFFYSFSKRKNSTKVPAGAGTEIECVLKDTSTVLSPVLDIAGLGSPPGYNYMFIPDFGRYYFTENWSYYRGIWTVTGAVDVLTSWETQIKATTAYVLFSSSNYNLSAIDNRIGATAGYTRNQIDYGFTGAMSGQQTTPGGWFALTALSKESNWATGAATTYFMTYQQMQLFARAMLDPGVWEQLKQFFTNPMDSIIDCYYLPINITLYSNLTNDIPVQLGEYTLPGVTAKAPQATGLAVKSMSHEMDIPWVYSDFRKTSKFTNVSLFVPFCGEKSIPPEEIMGSTDEDGVSVPETITVDYALDIMSGSIQAICYSTLKRKVLAEFSGNCKVQLPIGQTQTRIGQLMNAIPAGATGLAAIASGNVALGAAGIWNALANVVQPAQHKTMGGFAGSVLGMILGNEVTRWQNFRLICTALNSTTDPGNIRGSIGNVCGKSVTLGSLTGYCQTSGASVSISGYDSERDQINSLLDSGIFIE